MNYYKCIIAYDGTDFQGWQSQKNRQGIVDFLEKSFEDVFACKASIVGASRTDSGVHATGQVARIKTTLQLDTNLMVKAWNHRMPLNISIMAIQPTDASFHPMSKVLQKTYKYYFFADRPSPVYARYGWHVTFPINFSKLESALQLFVGTHDFRSFASGYEKDDTVRAIDEITLSRVDVMNAYCIEIKGKSFLHHMIRRIVGAAMDVATHPEMNHTAIVTALQEKTSRQRLYNAPACGLMLCGIEYEKKS